MTTTRNLGTILLALGWDPWRFIAALRFSPTFLRQVAALQSNLKRSADNFPIRWVSILSNRYMPGETAKDHYFHQDLWAARHIFSARPQDHIDVGSRIDGFVAHLLCFRVVRVLDVRPLTSRMDGLTFGQADFMGEVPADFRADSVSCLHALEHFGLGRYGDPLDLDGWKKGLENLAKITKSDGLLYISVPIGNVQSIEFNAHRIFSPTTIVDAARRLDLSLVEFSYIDDNGDFVERVDPQGVRCDFGCGCYMFRKIRGTLP